jgi:Asp-tRNA(Asn)/Glu-tRNA(Gln) amidotransferase A subunit family amidase
VEEAPQRFGEDVRAGVEAGARVRAVDYLRVARDRERARASTQIEADAVLCPACPILPPRLDEPDDVRTAGLLTRPFNVLDWPAVSVPVGEAPVGLQIAVPRGGEGFLWALALAAERERR